MGKDWQRGQTFMNKDVKTEKLFFASAFGVSDTTSPMYFGLCFVKNVFPFPIVFSLFVYILSFWSFQDLNICHFH